MTETSIERKESLKHSVPWENILEPTEENDYISYEALAISLIEQVWGAVPSSSETFNAERSIRRWLSEYKDGQWDLSNTSLFIGNDLSHMKYKAMMEAGYDAGKSVSSSMITDDINQKVRDFLMKNIS